MKFKNLIFSRNDFALEIMFISVLIVPFICAIDIFWMFTPKSYSEWETIHTPITIKLIKDILLIILLITLFLQKKKFSNWCKYSLTALTLLLICAILISVYNATPLVVIFSGIRWFLPIFLFPLFDQFLISKSNLLKLYHRYRLIIFFSIALEIIQIVFSNRWSLVDGVLYSRANGFFSQPQPMSLFSLFFLILFLEMNIQENKTINFTLSLFSILLTKSLAGILGIFYIFFYLAKNAIKAFILLLTATLLITFPFISGRLDFWQSPIQRLEVLLKIDTNILKFGSYTNTCNTINKIFVHSFECFIPDSLASSAIGNLGFFLGFIFLLYIALSIYRTNKKYLLPIYFLMAISANFTEYFPINFFFPFIIGHGQIHQENDDGSY